MYKLHGYSDATGKSLSLDLPYGKKSVRKDGLLDRPYVSNREKKTCPELLIAAAVMR